MSDFERKLAKLKRNPKLFFKDMLSKRVDSLSFLMPLFKIDKLQKNTGHYQYAVVSAVYNVEKYLDYFFRTLTRQTIGFSKHIHLVMVDDGSTDSSAEIIKKWQKKFPSNITYIYKANGGQASARNLGLELVESDYVTFIDPDDFVALNYFKVVDDFVAKNQKHLIALISCNFIFYKESTGSFSDTHPLRYRFLKGNRVIEKEKLVADFQLSSSSVFFDVDTIVRSTLKFDERIRPNFEDAHFVARFLELVGKSYVAFLKDAKYYYRKREDGTSTLDTKWSNPAFFDDVYRYGYIGLIHFFQERGHLSIPKYIQRSLLYDTAWVIKEIINKPEKLSVLSHEAKLNFLKYLDEIYASIDSQTILEFELAGLWFYHKVGLLHCFKNQKPSFQIVYVEGFDAVKQQVKLAYYSGQKEPETFLIDGRNISPTFDKTAQHDFIDRVFVHVRYVWLPVIDLNGKSLLSIHIGEQENETRISLAGKQYKTGIKVSEIAKHYNTTNSSSESFQDLWLLMDRDTQADDNAEHFYRYMSKNHPDQPMQFVLRKNSHDWARLKKEGFNLVAYGSAEHENALRNCGKIISSHADQYVVDYFRDGSLKQKPFIFLQHGVTKDDMSAWLNPKKIDCFITASQREYESISGENNRYKFSKKEVVLTGLARHDYLLQHQSQLATEKVILVAPTWRHSLMGKHLGGNLRELNPKFMESEYAIAWQSFLCGDALQALTKNSGYKVVFFPHTNIQPYLKAFNLPSYIDLASHETGRMQDYFCKAAVMITDFSSVTFEMAYLQKPVLYFQFDRESFYTGDHPWQKGYFDYDLDGFGPICFDAPSLLFELKRILEQDAKPAKEYIKRMSDFFAFRDGKNCERIYEAINHLNDSAEADEVIINALKVQALSNEESHEWVIAEQVWRQLLAHNLSKEQRIEAQWHLAEAILRQNEFLLEDILAGAFIHQSKGSPLIKSLYVSAGIDS